jgi:hypothetical protein
VVLGGRGHDLVPVAHEVHLDGVRHLALQAGGAALGRELESIL